MINYTPTKGLCIFIIFLIIILAFFNHEGTDFENSSDQKLEDWERNVKNLIVNYQNKRFIVSDETTQMSPTKHRPKSHEVTTTQKTTKQPHVEDFKPTLPLESESVPGILNVHIWEGWCGTRVEDLMRNKHFPLYPSVRTNISRFFAQWYETGYGERIFGYLHPPVTGNYTFAVSCDDNCQVWLGEAANDTLRKIAWVGSRDKPANTPVGDFKQYASQISDEVILKAGRKYYVEAVHKQAAFKDHLLLTWLTPNADRVKTISREHISSFMSTNTDDVNIISRYIPETSVSRRRPWSSFEKMYAFNRTAHRFGSADQGHNTPPHDWMVNNTDFDGLLPVVNHKPSYLVDFTPHRYEGVKLIHETAMYPLDYTELTHMFVYETCFMPRTRDSHGNRLQTKRIVSNGIPFLQKYIRPLFTLPTTEKPPTRSSFLHKPAMSQQNHSNALKTTQNVTNATFLHFGRKLMSTEMDGKRIETTRIEENNPIFKKSDLVQKTHSTLNVIPTPKVYKQTSEIEETERNSRKSTTKNMSSSLMSSKDDSYGLAPAPVSLNKYFKPPAYTYRGYNPAPKRPSSYFPGSSFRRRLEFDARPHERIAEKIIFWDGHAANVSLRNNLQMIRLYDIFGPAVHYLGRRTDRGLRSIYSPVLSECKTDGNLLLSKPVAASLVNKYMQIVRRTHGDKYSLKRIVNIEENHDIVKGDRYLIELDLKVKDNSDTFRLSRYIFKDVHSNKLYEPRGFRWNQHATVHVIVPVKNQGRWVQHFIDNMQDIYTKSNDKYLNVIIVDFASTDIDIEKSLRESKLKRYEIVRLDGAFERALGIQAGADVVKNDDDIIFTCDLHLQIPPHLIQIIRKHTIKGKMAFAPMVHRLSCGYTPELPYGLWETQGYGLFSISKYDFNRIGGMNTKEFKTKWGGEDWELVDRVLSHSLEVERFRVTQFFHYHHTKKRMWTSNNKLPLFARAVL